MPERKSFGEDRRVAILQTMLERGIDSLAPASNLGSPIGYWYPDLEAVAGVERGRERELLEHLADAGLLDRRFFERIHLCCYCGHYALNFREVCPNCASANAEIAEMIHHYSCGYSGAESKFRAGVRLTCPKCDQHLRHIGVDYERLSANYVCRECEHVFTEPRVSCHCLHCNETFDVQRAAVSTLHSYVLTREGSIAARTGTIAGVGTDRGIVDPILGLYTPKFFEERLTQAVASFRRYGHPLSILAAEIDDLETVEKQLGRELIAVRLKNLAALFKESLRDTDAAAIYRPSTMTVMLTDTAVKGAELVAERLRRAVQELNTAEQSREITVSIGVAGLSKEILAAASLLDEVMGSLKRAKGKGGNCVSL